jgi:hypothetical protein
VANKTATAAREGLNEWIEDMGRTG